MENQNKLSELDVLSNGQQIIKRAPCVITVRGRIFRVKQVSNKVRSKIADLEKEVYLLEKVNEAGVSLHKAKRIDRKIRTLHSKTAAYYLLNNWALFVPFLYAIRWRLLDLRDSEYTFSINEAGMNNKGLDFFLANWQITKAQLALSTRLVGEGINQYEERKESAEQMLKEDGLPTRKEHK